MPNSEQQKTLDSMTEPEMRDYNVPKMESMEDVMRIVGELMEKEHDYGTAVYAVSIACHAMFRYMAGQLGISGFQASCADLDIMKRIRNFEHPFMICDLGKLLYPQTYSDTNFPTHVQLLRKHMVHFQAAALELIGADNERDAKAKAHPEVRKHWETLAQGRLPGEEVIPEKPLTKEEKHDA